MSQGFYEAILFLSVFGSIIIVTCFIMTFYFHKKNMVILEAIEKGCSPLEAKCLFRDTTSGDDLLLALQQYLTTK